MALTREFKNTVLARIQSEPAFARALLDEAVDLFVQGEPELSKDVLRDLVNALLGFDALAAAVNKPVKSVHRMLSKSGNPTMRNVSAIFATLRRALDVDAPPHVMGA